MENTNFISKAGKLLKQLNKNSTIGMFSIIQKVNKYCERTGDNPKKLIKEINKEAGIPNCCKNWTYRKERMYQRTYEMLQKTSEYGYEKKEFQSKLIKFIERKSSYLVDITDLGDSHADIRQAVFIEAVWNDWDLPQIEEGIKERKIGKAIDEIAQAVCSTVRYGDNFVLTNVNELVPDYDAIINESVSAVITSPPYNVKKNYHGDIYKDDMPFDEYDEIIRSVFKKSVDLLCDGGDYIVNGPAMPCIHGMTGEEYFGGVLEDLGLNKLYMKVWYKPNADFRILGSADDPQSAPVYETILFYRKGTKRRSKPEGVESLSNYYYNRFILPSVWPAQIKPIKGMDRKNHPCIFPLELCQRLILGYSYVGETILDPFGGSCVLPLMASMMGRKALAFEISDQQVGSVQKLVDAIEKVEQEGESFWKIELPNLGEPDGGVIGGSKGGEQ